MDELEREKIQAEIDKLRVEKQKLEEEARHLAMLPEREGWRLFFYGIGTAGGILAVLIGAAKFFGG